MDCRTNRIDLLFFYSVGFNVIVGSVAVTVRGIQIINNKVKKAALERMWSNTTKEINETELNAWIAYDTLEKKQKKSCARWGISIVPIVGPLIAFYAIPKHY